MDGRREMLEHPGPTRAVRGPEGPETARRGGTVRIGEPGICFERELTCGGDQDNLNARRGRLPSGCDHSFNLVRPSESISAWPAFFSKVLLPLPEFVRPARLRAARAPAGYFAERHRNHSGNEVSIALNSQQKTTEPPIKGKQLISLFGNTFQRTSRPKSSINRRRWKGQIEREGDAGSEEMETPDRRRWRHQIGGDGEHQTQAEGDGDPVSSRTAASGYSSQSPAPET